MTNAQMVQEHYTGRRDRNGIAILQDVKRRDGSSYGNGDPEGRVKGGRQWRPKRRDK